MKFRDFLASVLDGREYSVAQPQNVRPLYPFNRSFMFSRVGVDALARGQSSQYHKQKSNRPPHDLVTRLAELYSQTVGN
jgi:hypothetical protein